MAGFAAATAKDTRTSFSVGITVNAVANIERQSAPTELQLSTQDLRRGYIDVLQPTMLVIRSNSANGYALDVTTVAPIVAAMLIHGLMRICASVKTAARSSSAGSSLTR